MCNVTKTTLWDIKKKTLQCHFGAAIDSYKHVKEITKKRIFLTLTEWCQKWKEKREGK